MSVLYDLANFTMVCFLAPLALGQRAYVMVRCPPCICLCVHPSVRALTFSLNIFSETTYQILMKFHSNVRAMVLFRISSDSVQNWLPWQQN